jgi:hypothetical protein
MGQFAFVCYVGELLDSPQPQIARYELEMLQEAMTELGLSPDWEVVWGPMLFRFRHTLTGLYDNFIFVAKNGSEYTVAVRGTNGKAKLDWVFEDFWVTSEVSWADFAKVDPPSGLDPKIAAATHLGVSKLLAGRAVTGVPGMPHHLVDFLGAEIAAGGADVNVRVTGHSLGGALAPTLGLYLADQQGKAGGWDPDTKAEVSTFGYAGPTAGNGDFATYTNDRMGTRAQRVVNSLDVVPLSWWHDGLEAMKSIYKDIQYPEHLGLLKTGAIDLVIEFLKLGGYDYQQYHQSGPSLVTLPKITNHKADGFMAQAGFQHVQGYEQGLDIGNVRGTLDEVYAAWCKENPDACPK